MTAVRELIAALERAPAIVVPLVRQANPEILKRRPAPGEWSIHENACHLAEVHPLFFRRLDLFLSEDDPVIASYDPGRDDPEDALLNSTSRSLSAGSSATAPGSSSACASSARRTGSARRATTSTTRTPCSSCSDIWRCTIFSTRTASRSCCCAGTGRRRGIFVMPPTIVEAAGEFASSRG